MSDSDYDLDWEACTMDAAGHPRPAAAIRKAKSDLEQLRQEIERLHSWDGLLELLDEHWPEDIFPVGGETDERRDTGARLVAAVRWIERLKAEIEDIRSLQDAEHDSQMGIRK